MHHASLESARAWRSTGRCTRRVCLLWPMVCMPLFLVVPAGPEGTVRAEDPTAREVRLDRTILEEIDGRMSQFVEQHEISGAVTVVGTARGIEHLGVVGSRNLESQQPMKPTTVFRIASMTKPITAMAIMILAEQGRLSIDDPLEKYLPEFRGQQLVVSRQEGVTTLRKPSRPVTLRDLLRHTSGLPGSYPEGFGDVYRLRHRDLNESALVMSQRPLEFEPGSKWAYCNTGIDLLGRVIEVCSGQKFEQFLDQQIFQPVGMRDTAIFPAPEQLERAAVVYEKKENALEPVAQPLIGDPTKARHSIPAGGLFSTGPDLARFYQMILLGGVSPLERQKRVVKAETLQEMTALQTSELPCGFVDGMGFGLGFAHVRKPAGVTAMLSPGTVGHGGAFGTQGWIDRQQGFFVILLIQRSNLPNADASPIRQALQEIAVKAIRR